MQKEVSYCQNNMFGSSYNGQHFLILSKKYEAFLPSKSQKHLLPIHQSFDQITIWTFSFTIWPCLVFSIIFYDNRKEKTHHNFWTKSKNSGHSGSAQTAWLTAALNCNFFALQTCADVVWQAGTDTHIRTCTV